MNRNILLSGGALLVATISFAQTNSATVTQTGTSQTATANQSGNALTATVSQAGTTANNSNNLGLSFQSGNGHTSTINQNNGSLSNRAGITQSNLVSGAGSNTATISQSNGSGGTGARGGDPATATGNGNWTGIFQRGDGNRATQTQDGTGTTKNFAETWQQGSTNTATTNQSGATDGRAQIYQGNIEGVGVANVTGNGATVDQSGSSRNDAFVTQLTSGNSATVLQSGNQSSDNIADIKQGTQANMTGGGNTAIIQQEKNTELPQSTPNSLAISTFNQAYITQLGTNGRADIRQRKDADRNYAEINQFSGNESKAYIQQEFESTSMNRAVINQNGDRQYAYSSQIKADQNKLTINQGASGVSSSDNQAYSYQSFSDFGQVTISQNTTATGGNNFAKVAQGYYINDPDRTVGNIASVQQEGSRNRTNLVQTGTASGMGSNTAMIGQYGNNNLVGGTARTPIPGSADTFESALQDGGMNSMTVTQNSPGGANSTVFNSASLSQTGMSNTLTINQTAVTASNMSTVNQTGAMNQAVVQQNGVAN